MTFYVWALNGSMEYKLPDDSSFIIGYNATYKYIAFYLHFKEKFKSKFFSLHQNFKFQKFQNFKLLKVAKLTFIFNDNQQNTSLGCFSSGRKCLNLFQARNCLKSPWFAGHKWLISLFSMVSTILIGWEGPIRCFTNRKMKPNGNCWAREVLRGLRISFLCLNQSK